MPLSQFKFVKKTYYLIKENELPMSKINEANLNMKINSDRTKRKENYCTESMICVTLGWSSKKY